MEFLTFNQNEDAILRIQKISEENGILLFEILFEKEKAAVLKPFGVEWKLPCKGCYSVWKPSFTSQKFLAPNWRKNKTESRLATEMPLQSVISAQDQNCITVALSDAKTPITIGCGVREETAMLEWRVEFFTDLSMPRKEYRALLRLDLRAVPYEQSLQEAAKWWETDCGYCPAFVPEYARLPMNSLWYSFHQQLEPKGILEECCLSKELGMETVLLDLGWLTLDIYRGYAYCGDWELATKKIPDMKALVQQIHNIGMKVMLWYSVPFIGLYSKNFSRFETMLLDGSGNRKDYWALDPRYKEVREFLVGIYEQAVKDWDLDGLKLDFIDSFRLAGASLEEDPRRDISSLEDAVDRLMMEVHQRLLAIRPDIMIEFRQRYVGPAIRQYGNMLRVRDCPRDAIINREEVVRLRLTSGKTAVHSDMLMWHPEESAEEAAVQVISVLYSVPQISMRIKNMNAEQRQMLGFYLSFWRAHREILLDGSFSASCPDSCYSQVRAEKEGTVILTAYIDPLVDLSGTHAFYAINATKGEHLYLKGAQGRTYRVRDCKGTLIEEETASESLWEVKVPLGGMVYIDAK